MAVFPAGHILTSADFDTLFPTGVGAWTSYTPTLVQGVTVTKTVNHATYMRIGRLVAVSMYLTCTSAGTANNAVTIGIPVTSARSGDPCGGAGWLYDASAVTFYSGVPLLATTTTANIYANAVTAAMGQTGGSFTAALASSDQIRCNFIYEAAA